MMLSAELFQAVIQSLRLDDTAGRAESGHGTLRARRVKLGGQAIIIPCSGESARKAIPATARDISPTGIALLLPLRMVHGEQFILHPPGAGGCAAGKSILCSVARYQHSGDSLFTIGATFTHIIARNCHLTAQANAD